MTVVVTNGIPVVPGGQSLAATDDAVAVKGSPNADGADSRVEGNVASGTADSGNPVKMGGVFNTNNPVLSNGQRGDAQMDVRGNLMVRLSGVLANGADGTSNGMIFAADEAKGQRLFAGASFKFNGTTWDRDRKADAVGRLPSSAATNNAANLKGAPGDLHHVNGHNATAGVKYLKLYNKATAPTVGTDTPFLTLALPASAPFRFEFPGGLYFSTGIGYGIVTGAADADNTAVAAGDILGLNIAYV